MTTDDLKQLDSEELDLLSQRVQAEVRRRRALRDNEARIAQLIAETQEAGGIELGIGEPWVQPAHALDAYQLGAVVTHNGKQWHSTTRINTWEPGVSGWHHLPGHDPETGEPGVPDYIPPTGAHDTYNTGDRVRLNWQVYESVIDNNSWSPTEHPDGWQLVTVEESDPEDEDDTGEDEETGEETVPEYQQPTGANDAYQTGEQVTWEGEVYEAVQGGVVWSPTDYPPAWKLIED